MEKTRTYYDLAMERQAEYENDILLAVADGRLQELQKTVPEKIGKVEFLTATHPVGMKTYVRGIIMVMMRAIYQVLDRDKIDKVSVEHSLGPGYYVEIFGEAVGENGVAEEIRKKIEDRMWELVKQNLVFEKHSINTNEAIQRFHAYGMLDKEKLFRYRRSSKTNIYNLDGYEDYFYGYMPYSTGVLNHFALYSHDHGLMLQLPTSEEPKTVPDFAPRQKLFAAMREARNWNKTMEIPTVGALNDVIAAGGMSDLMLVQEALQEKRIGEIAEQIARAGDKKFVMIAGPSSSGKTTFSHRLSIQLRTFGLKPHPIGVDDYFVDREATPKNKDGSYNFECLEAIDIERFNQDMLALLDGKTVELPTFNFKTGKREYKGNYKTLGPEDILVIEGIHGLNDKLSYSLPAESKFKIYISALTSLNIDEHNQFSTSDSRLIRRMVRDARARGSSAARTINMWSSVRAGEEQYIFPFQEQADVMFNSALIYELAVLKQYAEPILFGIREDDPAYMEAKRLLKVLDYFVGVSSEDVPKNSILREFVGNSYFHV